MKLTALSPIRHNGKRVADGEAFDVADKAQAAALVAAGVASDEVVSKQRTRQPTKPSAEQLQAATDAVAAAEAALQAAVGDDIPAAEQQLAEAQAALDALKG